METQVDTAEIVELKREIKSLDRQFLVLRTLIVGLAVAFAAGGGLLAYFLSGVSDRISTANEQVTAIEQRIDSVSLDVANTAFSALETANRAESDILRAAESANAQMTGFVEARREELIDDFSAEITNELLIRLPDQVGLMLPDAIRATFFSDAALISGFAERVGETEAFASAVSDVVVVQQPADGPEASPLLDVAQVVDIVDNLLSSERGQSILLAAFRSSQQDNSSVDNPAFGAQDIELIQSLIEDLLASGTLSAQLTALEIVSGDGSPLITLTARDGFGEIVGAQRSGSERFSLSAHSDGGELTLSDTTTGRLTVSSRGTESGVFIFDRAGERRARMSVTDTFSSMQLWSVTGDGYLVSYSQSDSSGSFASHGDTTAQISASPSQSDVALSAGEFSIDLHAADIPSHRHARIGVLGPSQDAVSIDVYANGPTTRMVDASGTRSIGD